MPESSENLKNFKTYRKRSSDQSSSSNLHGKVPPQAVALEEAVLGAIMLNKDALPIVIETLSSESFYSEAHRTIYKAMIRLF